MSELAQALRVAAALPELQRQEVGRASALLYRLPIAEVSQLADAIEQRAAAGGAASGNLREWLMRVRGEVVRVAEWEVRDNRCEHRQYAAGERDTRRGTNRAGIGEIGDATWIEAWIA